MTEKPFKGVIKLDVRDSTADWEPYTPIKAPEGAPNVLFILYDDTGLAAWSPFGGRINMPTLQKLADNGLMYLAMAYDGAVFTHSLGLPDRAQPSPERHVRDHGNHQWFPGCARTHPGSVRHGGADPAGWRLEHLLAG